MAVDNVYMAINVEVREADRTADKLNKIGEEVEKIDKKSKKAQGGLTQFDQAFSLIGVDSGLAKLQSTGQEVQGLTAGFKSAGKGVGGFKVALKGIKGAIMSTGIGLLVVAIGELVTFLAESISKQREFEKATYNSSASLEEMNKNIREGNEIAGMDAEEQIENLTTQLDLRQQAETTILNQTNTLKLQGKTEDQILAIQVDQLRMQLEQRKELIETLRISKEQRIKEQEETFEFVKNFVKFFTAPVKGIALMIASIADFVSPEYAASVRKQVEGVDDAITSMLVTTPQQVAAEFDKTIQEQENKIAQMENNLAGMVLRQRERARQLAREQNDRAMDALKFQEEASQQILDELKEQLDKEAELRQAAYTGQIEDFEEFEEELDEVEEQFEMTRRFRRRTRTKEEIAEAKKVRDAKIALGMEVLGALSAAQQLFGKEGTAAAKALAIADIAAGTAVGFIQALDIAQKGAKATGGAAPFTMPIFYASQVAAVLGAAAQAKQILQGGGSGGGGGSVSAPSGGSFTQALVPTLPEGTPEVDPQPIQAFVLETEISNTQALQSELTSRATL